MEKFFLKKSFLVRKPLIGINHLFDLQEEIREKGYFALEKAMRFYFSKPLLQEAIYIASPELYQEMQKWLTAKNPPSKELKLVYSLYKYFIRLCSRCTPYGLFAGCGSGKFEGEANISIVENEVMRKHSRLDMNYVTEIAEYISKKDEIRVFLKFYPNSSLYKVRKKYRFVEYKLKNKKRSYSVSGIQENKYATLVLEQAKSGSTIQTLVKLLEDNQLETNTAQQFVNKLINYQLLVSDLELTTTGKDFFEVLRSRLHEIPAAQSYTKLLDEIKETLNNPIREINQYFDLQKKITENFPTTSGKDLIQTDLFFDDFNFQISNSIQKKLLEQFQNLSRVNYMVHNSDLDTFRKKFYDRYEDEEISFPVALDSEIGIGYGVGGKDIANFMPLLENLIVPSENTQKSMIWDKWNTLYYQKLQQAKQSNNHTINISNEDIELLKNEKLSNFPSSIYAFGSFLSQTNETLDNENFLFDLRYLGGSSANKLLGRFGDGLSEIDDDLRDTCEYEQHISSDKIIAEIVHLPQSRIGNIVSRPNTFSYEIPYLGKSSVEVSHQIPIDDLTVSVRFGKVILRSKKFNKEVLPSLSNAHNFSKGLPIYKFLCDLQLQNLNQPFSWETAFDTEEVFLPRIQYKNIILKKASWRLRKEDFGNLKNITTDLKKYFERIKSQFNIPRFVILSKGDNDLLIDFESEPSLFLLRESLLKNTVIINELLQTPDFCYLQDSNGNKYTQEVVLPIITEKIEKQTSYQAVKNQNSVQRTFVVGSEWLYFKIYTGTKTADSILTEIIKPLSERFLKEKSIDKWFFIRYNDPDSHIRVRFHNNQNQNFWANIISEINKNLAPFIASKEVHKVLVDTYKREIERYGEQTIEFSEDVFFHDSEAIINFLDLIEGNEGEKYRWLFALRGTDMLLNDFDFSLEEKHQLLHERFESFFEEHKGNEGFLHNLNDKYRENRAKIEQILNPKNDTLEIEDAVLCFQKRSNKNRKLFKIYQNQITDKNDLLRSFIHMFLNRMFVAKQRLHELVIYHYLMKYYKSQIAQQKKQTNKFSKPEMSYESIY